MQGSEGTPGTRMRRSVGIAVVAALALLVAACSAGGQSAAHRQSTAKAEAAAATVDVKTLHAKIGELTLENDFLEGALTKAGMLSAKR